MALTTDQVKQLASQGPLSTGQVQNLATPSVPTTPTTPTITAASLAPQKPIEYQTTPTYTAPIQAPLPAPVANVALTSQEQGAIDQVSPYQALIDQLSGSTSELAQKSFRKQQAESTGLNAAQNLSQTLYDKNQSLDLRAQAIQAQKQADIQGLQNSAQQGGANVTKGGLAPQQRGIETRANQQSLENTLAKLDNAVSYYAATGKVREAQQAVDNAVDAEFTPKLMALDTAQRNLASLLKSPSLTTAQQKQALNLQAQYTAQENAIKDAAQVKKDTGDARIKAITNNPNMTQQQHDAISLAQSPEEVAALVNYFELSSLSQQESLDIKVAQSQLDKANYDLAHPNRQTQVIEGANGNTLLIDTNTGATIKDYGAKKAVVDTKAPEVKTINGVDKQWNPSTQEWEDIGSQNGEVSKKISDQLNLLDLSITNAEKYAGASGRSGIRKTVEGVTVGATDYTNLEAQINTLKTNMLTLATDPSIKKFFGPQMSNADVRLMMSAATPADPELQDPATLKAELKRLKTAVTTMKELANPGSTPGGQMYQNLVTAPDGTRIIITD